VNKNKRQSLLCPNCHRLISADEPHCPYCGLSRPGSRLKRDYLGRLLSHPEEIIRLIIYLNVAMFVYTLLLNPGGMKFSSNPLAFLSPSNRSLLLVGATGRIPIDQFHRWWTLIAASFLHGGILHIFFNMMALKQLGPFVVREYGLDRFLIIYTISGIVGFLVSYLVGVPLTIGASASICGLIGAILYYGKTRGGTYGEAIYRQAMGWIVGLAVFGLMIPGINNWGHGGGIVAGIVGGIVLGYREKKMPTMTHQLLAMISVVMTILVLGWAVVQSLMISFM